MVVIIKVVFKRCNIGIEANRCQRWQHWYIEPQRRPIQASCLIFFPIFSEKFPNMYLTIALCRKRDVGLAITDPMRQLFMIYIRFSQLFYLLMPRSRIASSGQRDLC
ncbi:hypothetical protein CEXT_504361 [Caerostris extrusa]|uniref:Uncharacterized protein n=1 Tax=Caerostris extrusa TaxID=172846 RepID=A0AAV4TKB8_CAEEX|nr:hypothetical protein CEXT_504361 [Caerostris extrusa]